MTNQLKSSEDRPKYLLLGEILRPHGIRGEVRMRVLTDYPERIGELETVYLGRHENDPDPKPYTVDSMRMHQQYVLLKLNGIEDRTIAERLRQLIVMVDIQHAVPLEEGEFYLFELIGLTVKTEDGETLGELVEVLETGANDVYIVASPEYGEVLLPAIESTIIKTDVANNEMIVRIPEGLIPNKP